LFPVAPPRPVLTVSTATSLEVGEKLKRKIREKEIA